MLALLFPGLVLPALAGLPAAPAWVAPSSTDDIFAAVAANDLARVRAVLDADPAAVRAVDRTPETPLHAAAHAGLIEIAKLLIERGADVNARAYNQFTPLNLTSNPEMARLLIASGADLERKNASGETELDTAFGMDHKAVADVIIAATGRSRDLGIALAKKLLTQDPKGCAAAVVRSEQQTGTISLFAKAVTLKDAELVNLLIKACHEHAPEPEGPESRESRSLAIALYSSENPDLIRALLFAGAVVPLRGLSDDESFLEAAIGGFGPDILEILLQHGAIETLRPENAMFMSRSPLSLAAVQKDPTKLKLLLKYGADAFSAENTRRAIFAAAVANRGRSIDLLKEAGVPVDVFTQVVLRDRDAVVNMVKSDPSLLKARDPLVKRSLLCWAVARRQHDITLALLDLGADANESGPIPGPGDEILRWAPDPSVIGSVQSRGPVDLETPLLVAAGVVGSDEPIKADAELVHILLERGADPNTPGYRGQTPLMQAAATNEVQIVRDLLDHKADPNQKDQDGRVALHDCTEFPEIVELLLKAGAAPDVADNRGNEPIDSAQIDKNQASIALLTAAGASPTMFSACRSGDAAFVRSYIATNPAALEANPTTESNVTPLSLAAASGQVEVVRVLIDAGAKIDRPDARTAPLLAAARSGRLEVVKLLLERGADLHASCYQGNALHQAAMYGHQDIVKFLVERGLDAKGRPEGGEWTPLHAAASWEGTPEVVNFLLDHGAEVNRATSDHGRTPLHAAASRGLIDVARVLLARGADPSLRDDRGMTPLDWAVRKNPYDNPHQAGRDQIAELLRAAPGK